MGLLRTKTYLHASCLMCVPWVTDKYLILNNFFCKPTHPVFSDAPSSSKIPTIFCATYFFAYGTVDLNLGNGVLLLTYFLPKMFSYFTIAFKPLFLRVFSLQGTVLGPCFYGIGYGMRTTYLRSSLQQLVHADFFSVASLLTTFPVPIPCPTYVPAPTCISKPQPMYSNHAVIDIFFKFQQALCLCIPSLIC